MTAVPRRQERLAGRHALVDTIPFTMPVSSKHSPALMAAFSIDADKARALIPCDEIHPFRLWNRGLLIITVIDYRETCIGKYIEFSIAIACTHGEKPAPRLLPGLFMNCYGTGQYVIDLPVSSEISVKGGKGIWGMPKHQANLDFVTNEEWISSQYDLDGQLCMRIDIKKPSSTWLPLDMGAVNYCSFRGMLMKSYVYFKTKAGISLFNPNSAHLSIGDHPRMAKLKELDIDPKPLFTGYFPEIRGVLDDHFECWFLTQDNPISQPISEGLNSTASLGLSQEWLSPPNRQSNSL